MALIGILLAVMMGCLAGYAIVSRKSTAPDSRKLAKRMSRPVLAGSEEILRVVHRQERGLTLGLAWIYRLGLMQKLEENLWQAGVYRRVSDVLLLMLLLLGFGAVIGAAAWQDPFFALGLGVGLALLPMLYVRIKRARRLRKFAQQLPFALDLLKSSLEAGHSLLRGLQVVVGEFHDPLAGEFRSVIEQSRLGLPLPRAMEEMAKRVPQEDLRLLIVAVRVQADVGSSLAVIIGRLADLVRTRQRVQAQVHALTAQTRMSGWVVGALPIILLGAFSIIQPSYTHTLFHTPSGQILLKVASVLDVMAFLSIRQLLKVKY